jgi:hypothetical protein
MTQPFNLHHALIFVLCVISSKTGKSLMWASFRSCMGLIIVAFLPHERTVEPQKPQNTHAAVERVAALRLASSCLTPPLLLLCNAEVNTSLRQLVTMQQ